MRKAELGHLSIFEGPLTNFATAGPVNIDSVFALQWPFLKRQSALSINLSRLTFRAVFN